jgi:hypothetical protein
MGGTPHGGTGHPRGTWSRGTPPSRWNVTLSASPRAGSPGSVDRSGHGLPPPVGDVPEDIHENRRKPTPSRTRHPTAAYARQGDRPGWPGIVPFPGHPRGPRDPEDQDREQSEDAPPSSVSRGRRQPVGGAESMPSGEVRRRDSMDHGSATESPRTFVARFGSAPPQTAEPEHEATSNRSPLLPAEV